MSQSEDNPEVLDIRKHMVNSPELSPIIKGLKNWPGIVLNSYKSARQPFHKISFIAKLGFNAGDPGIDEIIKKMLEYIGS